MNDELIKDKLATHDTRLNAHADRLDRMELALAESKADIKSLCKDIRNLTSVIKWACTIMGGSFITFFFYAIQHHLFK